MFQWKFNQFAQTEAPISLDRDSNRTCFKSFDKIDCVFFTLGELLSLFILLFGLTILLMKYKRGSNIFSKMKYYIIISLMLSCLFYILFNLDEYVPLLYFFQFYFQSCFTCFLILYLGSKVTHLKSNIYKYVYILFCGLMILNLVMLIYLIIEWSINENNYHLCQQNSFTILRSIGLFSQIIFTSLAFYLTHKIQDDIEQLQQVVNTEEEKTSLRSAQILVIVNLIGSLFVFVKNIIYFIDNQKKQPCRVIKHIGDENQINWSDSLDSTIRFLIELVSFFLPYILTLILFSRQLKKNKNKKTNVEISEPEFLSNYYEGLSFHRPENALLSLQENFINKNIEEINTDQENSIAKIQCQSLKT